MPPYESCRHRVTPSLFILLIIFTTALSASILPNSADASKFGSAAKAVVKPVVKQVVKGSVRSGVKAVTSGSGFVRRALGVKDFRASVGRPIQKPETVWTKGQWASSQENLAYHWKKHGHHFPTIKSEADYVRQAQSFISSPPKGTQRKTRENGDVVLYHAETNTFAVYAKDGRLRTMFKPDPSRHPHRTNQEYFDAQ